VEVTRHRVNRVAQTRTEGRKLAQQVYSVQRRRHGSAKPRPGYTDNRDNRVFAQSVSQGSFERGVGMPENQNIRVIENGLDKTAELQGIACAVNSTVADEDCAQMNPDHPSDASAWSSRREYLQALTRPHVEFVT